MGLGGRTVYCGAEEAGGLLSVLVTELVRLTEMRVCLLYGPEVGVGDAGEGVADVEIWGGWGELIFLMPDDTNLREQY